MEKKISRLRKHWATARSVWDESALGPETELSKVHKVAHFCVHVWRSFIRNRCPVRASALAYASLLALIPMLAVVMSITSTFLKKEGEERIDEFIVKLVASVTPEAMLGTNAAPMELDGSLDLSSISPTNVTSTAAQPTNSITERSEVSRTDSNANTNGLASLAEDERAVRARKKIASKINGFIQNTRSGALGVTGSIALIFVAISMLTRIEDTFNDIWGVARGRGWFTRIVVYWGVISLAPLLLVVAFGLATGPHLESTRKFLTTNPFFSRVMFQFLPIVVICFTFSVFYMLMPNTKVHWRAALGGGLVGGILFHLNNAISVLYVSRVVTYSKIYGGLALVPVFMIGLYFSWVILLFGAQVAYAFQNRATYLEEKQLENINQRGREFVALRLMTYVALCFEKGSHPPTIFEISKELTVPTRLIQQLMQTLCAARLAVEVTRGDPSYVPARPLQTISCHDILLAMRASQGQEMATRDEPTRAEVYGEFARIQEAERQAASSVTLQALACRAQAQLKAISG